jgi:hypothetical protein
MVMTKAERVAAAKKAARTRKRNAVTNGGKKKKPTIARNGRGKKKSNSSDIRKIAEEKYKNIACVWCGYPIKSVLQVAHVKKAKPKNNNPSNLVWLCPTHHREYDLKLISRQMILRRRKFMESFPEADWSNLFGLSKKELSARANKAWKNR